jgi:hypothetical protein
VPRTQVDPQLIRKTTDRTDRLKTRFSILGAALFLAAMPQSDSAQHLKNDLFVVNRGQPLLDAHNCYPDDPRYTDRLDRALKLPLPIGVEQDIAPYKDPGTGDVIPKVTHSAMAKASEPTLRGHFFERVRPIIEQALKKEPSGWPVIVLHFDFKNNDPELLRAVWKLLGEYESWITTAPKTADDRDLAAFQWKPLLVLTEDNDVQEKVFYRDLPVGGRLRLFGSAHTDRTMLRGLSESKADRAEAQVEPKLLLTSPATNYRRWWNNSWWLVEEGGQREAGDWTSQDRARLDSLVTHAHQLGYWVRFYTLDGFSRSENQGWNQGYNFGSHQGVEKRWQAAWESGVDMIATDQYELLARFKEQLKRN